MKRSIAMIFGLWFASMWLGCGMGEDEAWSDEDGVAPVAADDVAIEGATGETLETGEPHGNDVDVPELTLE